MLLAEKGVRGKGRQPLSPPQHALAPERDQRSGRNEAAKFLVRVLALQFCRRLGIMLRRLGRELLT